MNGRKLLTDILDINFGMDDIFFLTFPRKFNRRISELKKKREREKETSGYKSATRRFSLFFFSIHKLDTKKGEGGKLRLPGKRAIYSVKSAG